MSTLTDAEDILGLASAWREAGERVAVATVVETWAPPRARPGARWR